MVIPRSAIAADVYLSRTIAVTLVWLSSVCVLSRFQVLPGCNVATSSSMHIVSILPNESREFVVCRTLSESPACASLSKHAQYLSLEFICPNESLFKVLTAPFR